MAKYFGTDGIRGTVGQYPITPDFVLKLGWAVGTVFAKIHEQAGNNRNERARILIGKDTRISGYMFESALEAGLAAAGVDVRLLGPMPTPAIAYMTKTFHAAAGIVISASHNPYTDNGIKFFGPDGKKLSDDLEAEIEANLDCDMTTVSTDKIGKVRRIEGRGRYIEFCKSTVSSAFSLKGLKIAVDTAHGACYHIAADMLDELGAEVVAMGNEPDGLNINKECGSTKPAKLQALVKDAGADLGIAVDGDGDRLIMVDELGQVLDGDQLLYIMVKDRVSQQNMQGGVVGTLMSNMALELAVQDMGLGFVRANVGDRFVMAELDSRGWLLGGENSGHLLCLDKTSTGDAMVAAMQVLAAYQRAGIKMSELASGMPLMPQKLINVRVKERFEPMQNEAIQRACAEADIKLAGKGRVLLRASGTEPLIRVMVEGEDEALVASLCAELAEVVKAQ